MEDFIQLSLFGKMFQEPSAATGEKISEPCWKNLPGSQKQMLAFLDLRKESGQRQDILPEITSALHGGPLMLQVGEFPREEIESRLSWILEDNVPQRYYLSARACEGILNRASRRGKALPEILRTALLDMIEWWKEQGNMIDRNVKQNGSGIAESETMYSLTATDRHGVCCLLNDQGGQSIQVEDGRVSPTLRAESHAHEPVICAAFTAGQGAKANGIGYAEEQAPTLRTDGGLSAMPTVLCRAHGQANAETLDDCCPTLSCNHEQPIVFESHSQDARYTQQGDTSPACTAQWGTGGNNMPLVAEKHGFQNTGIGWWNQSETGATLRTPCGGDSTKANVIAEKRRLRWIVRRLTPTECERLQGFPDGWTDIGEWMDTNGKRHKTADSPRYKALGNSIALPQWWWITCKMARYLPEKATLGSLFDGIGGFPLVWETRHGKGTAVWASEIEEFPIAVTKMRLKEE